MNSCLTGEDTQMANKHVKLLNISCQQGALNLDNETLLYAC